MIECYSQPNQAERFIASGRVILAAFALFAIWLDPTEPPSHITRAYFLITGYLLYSLVMALAVWRTDLAWLPSAVAVHALDLLIIAVFMFLTSGIASPFFAFFVFSLISATLRWQWRGVIYTTAVALGVVIAMAVYPADLQRGDEYEINQIIFRIGYLLVAAALLGHLGAYEQRLRSRISGLAEWPRTIPKEVGPLVSDILQRSSSLLAAPRTLLLWKEEEEPLLHTASWSGGQFRQSIETPDTFGSLVAESLTDKNFFCCESHTPEPLVLCSSPTGLERWHGMPLHPELQRRFSIKSVLSFVLQSESVSGRLFALDNERMALDNLILGSIVSYAALCNLDQFYMQKRLQHAATMEERIRLARDLHDGLLQSLTGAALQLDTAHQLMEKEPQTARQRLLEIQKLISAEQQNLRSQIQQLKPPYSSLPEWDGDLPRRLKELAERIERQWGLHGGIDVHLDPCPIPWTMAQGVYFIVHEAMINAARHAKASSVQAEISSTDRQLQIVVADNGQGFPFSGRYDHAALTEKNLGPVILRERVTSLGGQMAMESDKSGARLEITLPIPEKVS